MISGKCPELVKAIFEPQQGKDRIQEVLICLANNDILNTILTVKYKFVNYDDTIREFNRWLGASMTNFVRMYRNNDSQVETEEEEKENEDSTGFDSDTSERHLCDDSSDEDISEEINEE